MFVLELLNLLGLQRRAEIVGSWMEHRAPSNEQRAPSRILQSKKLPYVRCDENVSERTRVGVHVCIICARTTSIYPIISVYYIKILFACYR